MKQKYKLETWTIKKWKGTKRETTDKIEKLVVRDKNGHFMKGKPVIDTVQIKNYGSGVYRVGKKKIGKRDGKNIYKIVVRQKISEKSPDWFENRKEVINSRKIYRCSYILNNVPISVSSEYYKHSDRSSKQSWTIGFRINAFSHSKTLLNNKRHELQKKLKKFVEECLHYSSGEFWFDSYYGWESPTIINAPKSDDGKYYLTLENMRGYVIKNDSGEITDL